jgi:hypothetical protein
MKRLMSQLRDMYQGRPAAVLGGGPSLPGDLQKLGVSRDSRPEGMVLIAVNYHAFHLVQADFMVYNDAPDSSDPRLQAAVESCKAVRVSPDPSTDVIFDVPVWTGFYSSNTAAWLALWMGCEPVVLCGMDCYQGERVYFHDYSHDVPCFHYPLDHHIRPWVEEGRNLLPHVERVRVMSGPLMSVFGAFEG